MNLPPAPPKQRGSFWNMDNGPTSIWDVGAKLLIWTAVLGFGLYLAWALSTS